MFIGAQDGKGTPRKIALNGAGFYAYPSWSPDGTKIAFSDNSRSLYVLDVASGAVKKISTQSLYSPARRDSVALLNARKSLELLRSRCQRQLLASCAWLAPARATSRSR